MNGSYLTAFGLRHAPFGERLHSRLAEPLAALGAMDRGSA